MQLACLACGATLCERSDAQSPSDAQENERYHAVDGAGLSGLIETDAAPAPTQPTQQSDNEITRCTRCDGSFHSPCVRKLGSPKPFECARCQAGSNDTGAFDDEEDDDEEIDLKMPLLVPLQALAYLRPEWKATHVMEAAAGAVKSKLETSEEETVGVCNQVNLLADQAATFANESAQTVVENVTLIICDGCDLEYDMATLDPPLAEIPEDDWFCMACTTKTEDSKNGTDNTASSQAETVSDQTEVENVTLIICDGCDVEYDIAALNPPLAEIPEGDWFCMTCATKTEDSKKGTEETVSAQAEVENVTLILCDCCELEYDMAALDPPLTEIPEGDWFCRPCIVKAKKSKKRPKKKVHKDPATGKKPQQVRAAPKQLPPPPPAQAAVIPAVPEELITILICDGCDSEFDAALIVPKLRRIPKGDWYCHACKANKITKSPSSGISTGMTDSGMLENSENSRRRKPQTIVTAPPRSTGVDRAQKEHASEEGSSRRSSPSLKRKRESGGNKKSKQPEAVDPSEKSVDGHAAQVKDTFPQVFFAPQAVSVVRNNRDDDTTNGSAMIAPGTVLLSEDEEDHGDDDDDVVIVCDICMGEFKMVETLKEGANRGVPPRPWYCARCLKSLKKTRKKRQRISKQMMLEMQIYGGLLRGTAEKTVDPETASLRGRPPSSLEETKQMHALVGQRVGIFFKWDKHWVMGRVVSYLGEHADHRHLVRFDDETEQTLPLYAFPMVIGTQTMLYVKVPAMQSQWWPAHLLRMNAKAKKLLLRTTEQEEATMRNFRLVSLFAENARAGKPQHVSCWVPKYLCRSMRFFSPPSLGSGTVMNDFSSAIIRSEAEKSQQQAILCNSVQSLLQQLNDKQWSQLAASIVGKDIVVIRKGQEDAEATSEEQACFHVLDYNVERNAHELMREGIKVWLDLRNNKTRFLFVNAADYGEWAVTVETTTSTAHTEEDEQDTSSSKEAMTETEELVPLAIIDDERSTNVGAKFCSVCLLPELIPGDTTKKAEAMVECVQCSSSYHLVCCDPPYDPFSLRNDEDGAVLIEDTKAPFVCHQCTKCAGCHTALASKEDTHETGSYQNPSSWVQWRLRLQSVSLCGSCVRDYAEDRYCSVCHLILKDDEQVLNLDLLSCSSCHLWVHAKCEPDPNPAFHKDHEAEFDLDVVLECLQLKQQQHDIEKHTVATADDPTTTEKDAEKDTADNGVTTYASTTASKGWNEEFRPSRIMDEEMSLTMKFDERYNPKIFNNYECFTCRKVRMLRVIHRLMLEDKLELFKEPVTKSIAPTYFDVIKSPMDLSSMQRKVLADAYPLVNFAGFRDDFELICLNAVTFNSKERDFLVWREAWRFYGQGQRIFRQIAPKSRMKHRGGKSYDALAIAAKRQLPSNSVMFGKNQEGDSNDSMFPDENDLVQDEEQVAKEADGKQKSDTIETADNDDHMIDKNTELADTEKDTKMSSHEEIASTASIAPVLVSETNAPVATNELSEQRRLPNGEASAPPSSTLVLQTELCEIPRPESRMDLIRILQSRPIAHTYCWMDMCARCGSAGLRSKMIFCIDCGEAFHSFCVDGMTEERLADNDALNMFWRCINCKMCELCGKPGGDSNAIDRLHFCGHCDRGYHGFCLTPSITAFDNPAEETKSKGKSSAQRSISSTLYCASCVNCGNCGQRPREGGYSYDRQMCLPCSSTKRSDDSFMKEKSKSLSYIWTADARKQRRDAERCPMCDQKWSAEDHELMQCDVCERWAHPKCDVLLTEEPERYRVLVEDPSAAYICGVCRPKERSYLSNVPHSWKCQILISKIQEKRRECHGQWRESRLQLAQTRQWQRWRENTPVFLYVLRLGEECLKNLAYRSVNFQENWYRFTKEQELVEKAVVIPNWLVQKASRYLRFKRYARGPKAARRRHARKQSTFYSQQGVEKHPEASAICTIVSEASSCAALLACVHLFYGWRPLSKVVLHMLEQDEIDASGFRQPPLSEALLSLIRIDDSKTLEEEITMIKTQYERRVGKRHLVRESGADGDQVMIDAQVSPTAPTAVDDSSSALTSPGSSSALTVLTSPREPSAQSVVEIGNHPLTPRTPRTPRTPTQAGVVVGPPIQLTSVDALYGWPSSQLEVEGVVESVSQPDFVDSRYCVFCYMVGDDTICGRLIYTDMDQWVHVNCALWSVEVYEDDKGVLQKCQRALNRGRNIRCDGCGVLGATIGCSVSRCQRHYHFPCALDYGVAFLPNGQTCCPLPSHMNMVARKMAVRQTIVNKPSGIPVEVAEEKNEEISQAAGSDEGADNLEANGTPIDVKDILVENAPQPEQQNGNIAMNGSDLQQSVLPVINPSHEPYRCLRSDMASYVPDRKRRVHTLKTKRQLCFRIGALTVHSLGHIMVGNASFHSQHALFPLGYRSTRIFWSTQAIQKRCVYECVVTSTLIEAKKQQSKQANDESEDDQDRPDVRALFKITPSDDREHPIVALTPDDALLTLRSRVVSLYERSNCFVSSDINPMLNRSSWFSFGLVGSHFFGFGLSEIAKELEQLPHVATTGISRQAITKLRKSRKRKHDAMENDNMLEEAKPDEEPYVFTHHLPSPQAFDEAQTEIERLVQAEERARLSSGSIRTDGYEPPRSNDSPMTKTARRRLNKQASSEAVPVLSASSTSTGAATGANGTSGATGTSGASTSGASGSTNSGVKGSGVPMDIEHLPIAMQYRELRRRPFDERLEVRKSKIHGYGLFTKEQMVEGQMIVEYQGQMISQDVADEREKAYEEQGIGSCYMFRLDEKTIIDATRCGNLARFINHSCDPKAYARVVCVDGGNEKKIVIFAKRTIEPGDEVTYDYKFPIEDEAIRCDCSAPNCIGRMN